LSEDAVYVRPHFQIAGVWNLITRRQKRSQRGERVCTLPLDPLSGTLQLKRALGIVVVQNVASHLFKRVFALDIAALFADRDR
jgi:hypothetical protein